MNKDDKRELIVEAIRKYKQDEIKERKRQVYHNTELLMKNYNELKQHSENAIYKANQISDNELIDDDYFASRESLYIGAILKSKLRTTIMVQHVEIALDLLRCSAEKKGFARKYEVLMGLFVLEKSYEQLAEEQNCDPTTIRRWKNDMLTKLGILLFGEEGLHMVV